MRSVVSVIIPVYNAGENLRPCLDSIRDQTWPDLEVWMVDDGSTDGSGSVCDEYIRLSRTGNKAKIIATFIPVEKPAPTTLKKVKKGKKKLTVVWKKQAKGTNGYVVQYATKEDFSDAQEKYVKKPKTTKLTIKKLKAKTKYYVRVCTYRLDEAKMVRSDWSNVKSAKTR